MSKENNNGPRLGVNIDHVATLRQARGEDYPGVIQAAQICLNAGADQITIHLREDRRHIQDTDVEAVQLVTKKFGKPLNLEIGCSPGIVEIAAAVAPDWVCIVPENREERTTEGGLNLLDPQTFLKTLQVCNKLKSSCPNIKISLFLEAKEVVIEKAIELKSSIDAVEIHTGDYARHFLNGNEITSYLKDFDRIAKLLRNNSIHCHAGHGLTQESVIPLLQAGSFEEYNIGHWIISEAVFEGLGNVVKKMKKSFNEASGQK